MFLTKHFDIRFFSLQKYIIKYVLLSHNVVHQSLVRLIVSMIYYHQSYDYTPNQCNKMLHLQNTSTLQRYRTFYHTFSGFKMNYMNKVSL